MIFAGQENPLSFSEARKYTCITKQITKPHKFAEIMKKNRGFGISLVLEGTLTVFFTFLKLWFHYVERKENF